MYQEEKMAMPQDSKQRLTLITALENLQEKNNQLKDLKRLSIKLNEKFNRTEGMLEGGEMLKEQPDVKRPNLIELFMDLADDMQRSINEIGNNTERVLNMID
jgi:hypothetical protein